MITQYWTTTQYRPHAPHVIFGLQMDGSLQSVHSSNPASRKIGERSTMKLRRLAALVSAAVLALGMVTAVSAGEKITICHAAGLDGTTKFVTLTISENAVFGEGGHFNENGTTQAGHEQDYMGACSPEDEPSVEPCNPEGQQNGQCPEKSEEPSHDASSEPSSEASEEASHDASSEPSSEASEETPAKPPADGEVAGLTSDPTLPPTDALSSTETSAPDGTLPLVLIVLGVIGLAAVVLTPARAKR
jgi:hypothetical protein